MKRTETEYDQWAQYYDLVHEGLPGEAEFYVCQALRIGGKALELGCGTGRLAIPMTMSLSESGKALTVVGVDNSRAMLDVCLAKKSAIGYTPGQLYLVQADMTEFEFNECFDFIAMAYRTFMHLLTPNAQKRCLNRVNRHLSPRGTFMMNMWLSDTALIAAREELQKDDFIFVERIELPEEDGQLLHDYKLHYDDNKKVLSEVHLMRELNCRGEEVHRETLPMVRRLTSPSEMHNLAKETGFEVQALFGDFDCSAPGEDSTEMIWVLKKA